MARNARSGTGMTITGVTNVGDGLIGVSYRDVWGGACNGWYLETSPLYMAQFGQKVVKNGVFGLSRGPP